MYYFYLPTDLASSGKSRHSFIEKQTCNRKRNIRHSTVDSQPPNQQICNGIQDSYQDTIFVSPAHCPDITKDLKQNNSNACCSSNPSEFLMIKNPHSNPQYVICQNNDNILSVHPHQNSYSLPPFPQSNDGVPEYMEGEKSKLCIESNGLQAYKNNCAERNGNQAIGYLDEFQGHENRNSFDQQTIKAVNISEYLNTGTINRSNNASDGPNIPLHHLYHTTSRPSKYYASSRSNTLTTSNGSN